ncbi:MAG: hypothetical protein PHE46_01275 [Bacteroidales bacterium]|nr:hypothetical protein [Bacteroidales bacterium]
MGWNIESTYPLWLAPLAALIAIGAGWWVYYRKQDDGILPRRLKPLLMFLRASSLFLIAMLIISPWMKKKNQVSEKPTFLIAMDNSRSMFQEDDTLDTYDKLAKQIDALESSLNQDFNVHRLLFGASVRSGEKPDFSDQQTNFEDLFKNLTRLYGNRPVQGLLIISDGAYNRGLEPSLAAAPFPFPVHVLATGDTVQFLDLAIGEVIVNEWVRRKSLFPVRVYFKTSNWGNNSFNIQIINNGRVLEEETIDPVSQQTPYTDFMLEAPDQGDLNLTIRIRSQQEEKNPDNNSRNITIRVIDKEGRVLILADAPHPDIAAIRLALGGVEQIQTESFIISDFPGNLEDYSLLILHGLPSSNHSMTSLMEQIAERRIPVLFILNQATNPQLFNRLETGCQIVNPRLAPEEAQGHLNRSFNLFTLPEDFPSHLAAWPPLELPYQTFALSADGQILMTQIIRRIEMMDPLMMITSAGGAKYGVIAGTGIWRWRLFEFVEFGSHVYFDDLLSRITQFLLADEQEERFKIILPDELYEYNPIRVTGYLRNRSMESINTPDINLSIQDSAGNEFSYLMGRQGEHYQLDLKGLRAGLYQLTAQTDYDSQHLEFKGDMAVSAFSPEGTHAVADHLALKRLTHSKNGSYLTIDEPEKIVTFTKELSGKEPAYRLETSWFDPISLGWLLPLLVLFLSLEWFLRRWFGTR